MNISSLKVNDFSNWAELSLDQSFPFFDPVGIDSQAERFESQWGRGSGRWDDVQLAIGMVDLTTLEGTDTPERVRALCDRAMRPGGSDDSVPPVAAVCVWPTLVAVATKALKHSPVLVASVAGAFPSGQAPLTQKVSEIRYAINEGADEIDMVISRGKFLTGNYQEVFDEICQCREVCQDAPLKVILETGELGSAENIYHASVLSMAAGADFIKTSTGKISPAATFPASLVMLHAIDGYFKETGRMVGFKVAGGVRSNEQALGYLSMVRDVLGERWMTNEHFRMGASSLLDDLVVCSRRNEEH